MGDTKKKNQKTTQKTTTKKTQSWRPKVESNQKTPHLAAEKGNFKVF